MALPTLSTRPEKIINSVFLSRWNAAALPIQYVIENTKWPVNSEDSLDDFSFVSDRNGYAFLAMNADNLGYSAGDYISITGTSNYNGIHRILEVVSIANDAFVIDTAFIASDSGDIQRYYQNYTSLIRVYADATLIGTIEQRPNTDNKTYADVRKYILSDLNTDNDINQATFPNDENLWTPFYIEFAERYDDVVAGTVVNTISAYTSDSSNPCYASHSALQFGNARGGNMADYLIGVATAAKWMTFFTRPTLFTDQYFDITILNAGGETVVVTEYDINSVQLATQNIVVSNNGVGVYRIRLDDLSFNALTEFITIIITGETEELTIDLNKKCSNQSLHLAWLNSLGGWEYWKFTARNTHGYNIGNVQTIKRDILQDWDTDFIAGQTEREHISIEASKRTLVRSQELTTQQVEAIARIKAAIKVLDFTDPDNPVTLIVDKNSFDYTTDKEKLNYIQFTVEHPGEIIQSQ